MGSDFLPLYFSAEKHEALLFVAIGLAAITASWVLYRRSSPLVAMTGPLIAIAAIQIVVGGNVFLRTDAQMAELHRKRVVAPAAFKIDEGRRMATVMRNFEVYRAIELTLLATGIAVVAALRRRRGWRAFGIGLALQSAVMLTLDMFAEARGQLYLQAVLAL